MQLSVETVAALASLIAVGIAIAAYRLAAQTFRRDHRPLVRVVRTVDTQVGLQQPDMRMDVVILKNVGRGIALTVVAFDPSNRALIGDAEVAEPLGPADREQDRPGRIGLQLRQSMTMDSTYELYYQDVLGEWHLTRFRPRPGRRIECTFAGEVKERDLPGEVKILGTVARP